MGFFSVMELLIKGGDAMKSVIGHYVIIDEKLLTENCRNDKYTLAYLHAYDEEFVEISLVIDDRETEVIKRSDCRLATFKYVYDWMEKYGKELEIDERLINERIPFEHEDA